MGGSGSGSRQRYYKRRTVDEQTVLNLNAFRKRGKWKFLNASVTWSQHGSVTASIAYSIDGDSINFAWQNREGQFQNQTVALTIVRQWIGVRYYFICPHCQRRVINLYAGSIFLCRHCSHLTYKSCQESGASCFGSLVTRKRFDNFSKALLYHQELKSRKRIGRKMLKRLQRYIEKSGLLSPEGGSANRP